jgi:hypothetical protein
MQEEDISLEMLARYADIAPEVLALWIDGPMRQYIREPLSAAIATIRRERMPKVVAVDTDLAEALPF